MSLQGLPDFQKPILDGSLCIFYPYERTGDFFLVPEILKLANRSDGSPDFLLEFIRGINPSLPPEPHGLLDFRVMPDYKMKDALALLRSLHPEATLDTALFSSGYLHMLPVGEEELPGDLRAPVAMIWNGMGTARSIIRLTTFTATMMKKSLESQLLALNAYAELEMMGVSPRLPLNISFDPAQLLKALAALEDEKHLVPTKKVVELLERDPGFLPLTITGDLKSVDLREFAEAIMDRIRYRFGTFFPSPDRGKGPYISLISQEEISSGTFNWELSDPIAVPRAFILDLRPLEALREWTGTHKLERIFRESVIPVIKTGFLSVSISANLPESRIGVFGLGVTLRAPPNPPYRASAIVESIELKSPDDSARILLRFSPAEKSTYSFSTYAVINAFGEIKELYGEEKVHEGERLNLHLEDFPVEFISVMATSELLEIARMRGICKRVPGGSVKEQHFDLDSIQAVSLAVPRGVDATIEIEAHSRKDDRILKIGPLRTKNLHLGFHSFSEYGPHKIDIECIFGNRTGLYAIDLLPEGSSEDSITVLHFTPSVPRKEWIWFAKSPFQGGYRYREHPEPDRIPAAWSEVLSPFKSLSIEFEKPEDNMKEIPESFNFQGIYCYRNKEDPFSFFYIPAQAMPEAGPDGQPSLLLLVSDQGAILQIGTRLTIEPDLLESLRKFLPQQYPGIEPASIRLAMAPISIEGVSLSLGDGTGKFEKLKTERSSSYIPFNAIFNVTLDAVGKTKTVSAINGNRGFLKATYSILLPVEYAARTSITADVKNDLVAIGRNATIKDALARVESGIGTGTFRVDRTADPGASDEMKEKVDRLAKDKAAAMLLNMALNPNLDWDKARLDTSAYLTENIPKNFERSTDVGSWFPAGSGANHIQVVGVTIIEPKKDSQQAQMNIAMGFDAKDVPVAFVEIEFGEVKAKLVGPDFNQVVIPAGSSKELTIRTSYTDGGPRFQVNLPKGKDTGWNLGPEDLGLTKVVLDGSMPKAAGSREARVRVRYKPSGSGTDDDRTIYFRKDTWMDNWYIVTRAADLAGILEFDWREIAKDGSVVIHPSIKTDKPEIRL